MITLITGKMGGGKTVLAVDYILKINDSKIEELKDIQYIYTNIGGFKFELFKDKKIIHSKLVFNKLYLHLKLLYSLYKTNEDKDNLDDILIKYCKEHNLYNSYFVIDECQNYFKKDDDVKMWWLTYHRHLHHEILFITQNKSLLHSNYRNLPEVFIDAQPRSKAIKKDVMIYFHYSNFRMSKADRHSIVNLKVTPKHFEVYKSGNLSSQKQLGKKFIVMFIIFFITMILVFTYFIKTMIIDNSIIDNNIETVTNIDKSNNNLINEDSDITNEFDIELSNLKYMLLKCNTKLNFCLYKNQKININFYLKMKKLQNFQEIAATPIMNNFVYLEVFVTDTFYSIYNKEFKNEKDNITSPSFFPTNITSN